jgi:hypothetical protein
MAPAGTRRYAFRITPSTHQICRASPRHLGWQLPLDCSRSKLIPPLNPHALRPAQHRIWPDAATLGGDEPCHSQWLGPARRLGSSPRPGRRPGRLAGSRRPGTDVEKSRWATSAGVAGARRSAGGRVTAFRCSACAARRCDAEGASSGSLGRMLLGLAQLGHGEGKGRQVRDEHDSDLVASPVARPAIIISRAAARTWFPSRVGWGIWPNRARAARS